MNRKHVTAALSCTTWMIAAAHAAGTPAEAVGRQFLMAFRDCQARHDAPACSRLIADDAMIYEDDGKAFNKEQFLRDLAPNPDPDAIVRHFSDPQDTHGWRVGDTVFFHYRSVWSEMYGTQPYRIEYRATLVLGETDKGPRLQMFQATPIPNTQRQPAKVDPAVFDLYVGEYSAGRGDREVITREGGKLLMTINGAQGELLPIDASTFYIRGESDDWRFVRDAQGKVTGLESRYWGQNVLATRLP